MSCASRKTILIAGATGFIGRNLLNWLSQRDVFRIRAVYNKRPPFQMKNPAVEWVQADLTQHQDVERVMRNVDIVIQAAATTSGSADITQRPYIHVTDNAIMNSLMLRASYDLAIEQFVFFSCSVMYQSSSNPVKEEEFCEADELHPNYFGAGWTKLYIEKMCRFYAGLGKTKYTILRHSNIFGPHDKFDLQHSHIFGATVRKVMEAPNRSAVTVWGNGEEKRDLLYIDDLSDCVSTCIENHASNFRLFNVGSGVAISVNQIVKEIILASGRRQVVQHDLSKPNIPFSLALDSELIKQELGWLPKISFSEGVRRTLGWYSKNLLGRDSAH